MGYLHAKGITAQILNSRNIYLEPKVKLSLLDQGMAEMEIARQATFPQIFKICVRIKFLLCNILPGLNGIWNDVYEIRTKAFLEGTSTMYVREHARSLEGTLAVGIDQSTAQPPPPPTIIFVGIAASDFRWSCHPALVRIFSHSMRLLSFTHHFRPQDLQSPNKQVFY